MTIALTSIPTGVLRVRNERDQGYTVVAADPRAQRKLWREYLFGAESAYDRHGCAAALELDAVISGEGTALFYAVLDDDNQVVGGLRVQHRFDAAAQSHAREEWAGQPGQVDLVNAIESRLAGGVVEVKTAWVDERSPLAADVAGQLSRLGLVIMEMSGVDHMMATAADHVLRRWESGGGRVDESVSATPFPDDRYRTRLMWWERAELQARTSPETWRRMRYEADMLQTLVPQSSSVRG
jgi:hypothetical protein